MKILLVSATEFEISPFLENNYQVEVLITGVGICATTYHLTKVLQLKTIDLVIQAGIAGTFSDLIFPAEVVLVEKDTFGDLGILEAKNFQTIFDIGLHHKDSMPYEDGWLINKNQILKSSNLKKVTAITVNSVTDSPEHT